MRILMVHNFYQQKGGEDVVFAEETQMLRDRGHEVFQFTAHNDNLNDQSPSQVALNMVWSRENKQAITAVIQEFQPDVAHFHNTFMSISPAAYYACKDANVPVVQTLHNYRLICPKGTLFREGQVCTACVQSKMYLPAIRHRCYRGSGLHTAGVATMLNLHHLLRTWDRQIDRYICLSDSGRQLFIDGGISSTKLVVKGNFLCDAPDYCSVDDGFFLFMGRLTEEKGVRILLEAWKQLSGIPLVMLGEGPLWDEIENFIQDHKMTNIQLLGHVARDKALTWLQRASAQIVPSQWYEPFGLVAIEAFACGKPVIASNIGALANIVEHKTTGLHFRAAEPDKLAKQVQWLWSHPRERQRMGKAARDVYEQKYTSQANYCELLQIYKDVIE